MSRWKRWLAAAAKLAVAGIAILLTALLLDHRRETILPAPTGPFPVGRTRFFWSDPARQVVAWMWYPAASGQSPAELTDAFPASWRTALQTQQGPVISNLVNRDLSRVRAHSIPDAPIAPQQRSYPVLFMRAGLAALTLSYTSLAEDLASHGYAVVGLDAPYRTSVVVLPDGRTIRRARENDADLLRGPEQERLATRLVQAWTADTTYALNRLQQLNSAAGPLGGHLDLDHVGAFGHSLGGATSLQFCHDDLRCKAGIDLDGAPLGNVVADGVTQPFMFLLSAQVESSDPESNKVKADIKSIYGKLPPNGRVEAEIRGANHFLFSDDGALLKNHAILWPLHLLGILGTDGRRQLAITAGYVESFFDTHLKGKAAALPVYPEIRIIE